ncbi:Aryl-alcohol dehydrogenase [Rhodoplanes serenus]|uniref:Aryl-alcohol dehydrogenase n=1 Tax=Rhodoplanes serenus TaxID=200615 RepID=A0A3S4B1X0_9BRAD|nr:NAD(P)-dependent alcohol dehydrogenase [Rhodoplanes serenus]VCU09596.1 Aryl-alcohol dehydrogenase [Rhodoplanes serenus]
MKITAAVARATAAPLSLESLEIEAPRDGEILVRVVATGICHTDIAMRDQTYPVPQPIVLGHEGAGVVEAIGRGVGKVAPGDHVVMSYNSCGSCDSCHEHRPNYCHDFFQHNFAGVRHDGSTALRRGGEVIHANFFGQSSFATHALCHERNVVKVRNDVPLELLGPLACGIQTGAGAVINSFALRPGETIAVFGVGSVGLSAVMAARVAGATTIVAIDTNAQRLALAQTLGATHVVDAKTQDAIAAIMAATGTGTTYALETTAIPRVIRTAIESLAPRGTCGILGASTLDTEITLNAMHLMTAGRSLRGIIEGDSTPDVFVPRLIELFRQGRFPFDKLVTFYPFDRINDAIHDAETGKVVKPIVRM